jgi:SAM-dependent methyltransferase
MRASALMSEAASALTRFQALLTPRGQELLAELAREQVTPQTWLRAGSRLRSAYPADLVADAMSQHELRQRARAKFAQADRMYFTRDGLEQASAEVVARHRARRYRGTGRVADLCCGIGGDLVALAGQRPVLAVDRDPLHLRMAEENARALGVGGQVSAWLGDVRDASLDGLDGVFIDPARRAGQRRLRPGDSEPPLPECLRLAGEVARVGIKAAPGIARDAVPPGWELEFTAVGRELKEAALWSPALATAPARATILPGGDTLAGYGAGPVPVAEPGEFLLDPSPAVTRAGLVEDLARMVDGWKIDPHIAFLGAAGPVRTPFARVLRVIDSGPWRQKELPSKLRALDIGAVDIRRRGLAGDVAALHKNLRMNGSRRATLVMTRVAGQPWGLVCLDEGAGAAGQVAG